MSSFDDSSLPASTRAVRLVSRHHGLPEGDETSILLAASAAPGSLRKIWKQEAKANHLRARRRTIRLEEIPEVRLPVILEIDGAKNFVVLLARESENEYRIQFPDTREAIVSRDRIAEVYDGTCVFFFPERKSRSSSDDVGSGGTPGGGVLRRLFRGRASSSKMALFFNAGLIGTAGLMITSQEAMRAGLAGGSGLAGGLTLVAALMFSIGAIQLRKEFLKDEGAAGAADLVCASLILPLAVFLGGSIATPLLVVALLVAAYLFVSRRLGTVDSRLSKWRRPLLLGALVLGVAGMLLRGEAVEPVGIVAVFGLGIYALYLLMRSDRICQESRLFALS